MKAFVVKEWGEPEVFSEVELPKPEVKPGHVIIRVEATSVNPVDYRLRRFGWDIAPQLPAVLHGDVAGVIEEVGEGVTRFKPGDEVYGCAGGLRGHGGALADYMLADADLLARKPAKLSWAEAAALPLVTITAWEGLFDRAKIQPGQTVLVQGATGGVGHVAIQLAKWAGAKVYATVSSEEKAKIARELGADYTINYKEQSVEEYVAQYTAGKGFDVVFDSFGGDSLANSLRATKIYGTVVTIQPNSQQDLSAMMGHGLTLHVVFMLIPMLHNVGRAEHGKLLTEVAKLADEGYVRPIVDQPVYTFAQAAQAHRRAESGQHIGKVVLTRR